MKYAGRVYDGMDGRNIVQTNKLLSYEVNIVFF